mgnify:CR=1 FL=1
MFKVGQKVVCVDDSQTPGCVWKADKPRKGSVYSVTEVGIHPLYGHLQLGFSEIKNSPLKYGRYAARRFRPVVERKTDISIFTAMLNPAKAKEFI